MSNVGTYVILCIAFVCLSSLAKERSCRNFRCIFFLVFYHRYQSRLQLMIATYRRGQVMDKGD